MSTPMDALMDARARADLPPLAQMPGRRWAGTCGPWSWLVNGSGIPITTEGGVTVMPFHTYIEFNGWPAGVLDAVGEGEFAAGTGANPEAFAAALAEWPR